MQVSLPPSAATETRNPASMAIDRLAALQIVELMNREDAKVAAAAARAGKMRQPPCAARLTDLMNPDFGSLRLEFRPTEQPDNS